MIKRRLQRSAFVTGSLLLLLAGGCVLWLRAQQRQYALNRQLIAALVQADDYQALALVNEGADPNTHYKPTPAPSLPELVKQFFHRLPSAINNSPTALLLACGASWNDGGTQIHRPDTIQLVTAMLQHDAKVNAQDQDKWTPLQWAIYEQRWRTASVLLQYGADANTKGEFGDTPLMTSLMFASSSQDVVHLLLEHGADVNAKADNGLTPLIAATHSHASPDLLRILLERGADVNATDDNGNTPLSAAMGDEDHAPDTATVRLLLDYGARVNVARNGQFTLLANAVYYVAPGTVRLLLAHRVEVNAKSEDGWTALHWAVHHAILPENSKAHAAIRDILCQLLAHGANPNVGDKDGVTPLMMAQRAGRSDLVALLRPAEGSARRQHAQQRQHKFDRELIAALMRYDTRYALVLVNEGADPNTRYEPTPLPTLRQWVNKGIHQTPPPINNSPTAFAIACGAHWIDEDDGKLTTHFPVPECVPLVQAMIAHGANVNDKEWDGETPLSWASWQRAATVKLLLEHGARK